MSALSSATRALQRANRVRWTAAAHLKARAAHATLELDIDPAARVSAGAVLAIKHGTTNRIIIGPGCRIEDGVVFDVADGTIVMGPNVEVRRHTVLHVAGTLTLAGDDILSWGCTVHCARRIDIGRYVGMSEYVTMTDSRHFHTPDDTWFYHNTESAPVSIGSNVWVASKATVLMGTRLADRVVVACNSVVGGDVPEGVLVAGAPARTVRAVVATADVRSA